MKESMLFDKETLDSSFKGDEDILLEIVSDFCEQIPSYIEKLNLGIESSNFSEIEITAHTLKGLGASFYSSEIKTMAFNIEQMAIDKKTSLEETEKLIVRLKELGNSLIAQYKK